MPLALAEVLADHWPGFARRHAHRLVTAHYRAVQAVLRCRTKAMGGRVFRCKPCRKTHYAYFSCNHRSCPQCGALDQPRQVGGAPPRKPASCPASTTGW